MISVLVWLCFYLCICTVQRIDSVRIFNKHLQRSNTTISDYEPYVVAKTCYLIPDIGPCRSKIKMWFYDSSSKNCSQFEWGGCQGNGNRFDRFSECTDYCISKPGNQKYRPRYCQLTFDYGFCFGAVERWYYDSIWKVCKSRLYSGCGGNKNNFYNKEQCDQLCRFGNPYLTKEETKDHFQGLRRGKELSAIFNGTTAVSSNATSTTRKHKKF